MQSKVVEVCIALAALTVVVVGVIYAAEHWHLVAPWTPATPSK